MTGSTEANAADAPSALGLPALLDSNGFNVAGVLPPERYDQIVEAQWRSAALLPEARTVIVLGCGGPAFARAARASKPAAEDPHPLDEFARRTVAAAVRELERAGSPSRSVHYFERRTDPSRQRADPDSGSGDRAGGFVDMVALARHAGLGVPSRLGILLHPVYGPWLSVRALILTERVVEPTLALSGFNPCERCPAPCAEVCPTSAVAPRIGGVFDLPACVRGREQVPACRVRCDARRACVVGRDHVYDAEAERYFMEVAWRIIQVRHPSGSTGY